MPGSEVYLHLPDTCHSLFTDLSECNSVNTTVQFAAADLSNSLKQIPFLACFPYFEEIEVGF
jgi:hypothetical protein